MKRRSSLLISMALIAAYVVKNIGGMSRPGVWAFALPPLAVDLAVLLFAVRAYRCNPQAQDDSWGAYITALVGTHLFLVVNLLGIPLVSSAAIPWLQLVGTLCISIVCPVVIYVLFVLGESWSIIPEARRLVTVGPYAISRHPLYMLYVVWYVALVLIGQSPIVLALGILNVLLHALRAKREEEILALTFGDDWKAYCAETGWLGRRKPFADTTD